MSSVPNKLLCLLLAAMCALCIVQWVRESTIRETALSLNAAVQRVSTERDKLTESAKAADAEILRLTSAFSELRTKSAPKADLDAALDANAKLKEQITQANEAITKQNEALKQQAEAAIKANDIIKKTATERDDLARKTNDITTKYNALLKKQDKTEN